MTFAGGCAVSQIPTTTLSQTSSSAIAFGTTIACSDGINGATRDNTWYRAFSLADYAIEEPFHVTGVSFAVQEASGSAPITITIGAYAGSLDAATLDMTLVTPLATTTATPPDTTRHFGETVEVALDADIAKGGAFVVGVSEPDMDPTGGFMYIGATDAGESHHGYIASSGCNVTTPETTVSAGGTGQIIIEVAGLH
jgi:hypothetical protein